MELTVSPLGWLEMKGRRLACRLGRSGVCEDKSEGDGATPVGNWPLRAVFYRPDRVSRPMTALPVRPLAPDDGWCDDPAHSDYNRPVHLPHPASCEKMWRDDGLYDVVVVLGHNDSPPVPGKGSAIFLHVTHPEGKPTQGCVALPLPDLLMVLENCHPGDSLVVLPVSEQG
ncbi:MAG: L,D-transpeptidase family protein [Magnetospirillum gryphiswaldense]|nr:L,D-transpeptidase family protein [Magnetospirillum gryphiswaldense]